MSLMDVALQCLTTIHGDWQHTYKLKVPTSLSSKAAARYGSPEGLMFKCLLMCVCVRACMRVCVHACMHACVCVCVLYPYVHARAYKCIQALE